MSEMFDDLKKLSEMLEKGDITPYEYDKLKADLLGDLDTSPSEPDRMRGRHLKLKDGKSLYAKDEFTFKAFWWVATVLTWTFVFVGFGSVFFQITMSLFFDVPARW